MIAADTSVLIDYFQGCHTPPARQLDETLARCALVLPPVVQTEVLSDALLPKKFIDLILELPVLALKENFWQRAGILRSRLLAKKLKARLADTLIAQSCIDHRVSLITRDADFQHFVTYGGLDLY